MWTTKCNKGKTWLDEKFSSILICDSLSFNIY